MTLPSVDHSRNLKRATLAALIEAANAISGVGPLLAGAGAFYRELKEASGVLPDEIQQALQAMATDFRAFLKNETGKQGTKTVGQALLETLALLDRYGLSLQDLVEADLDADKATSHTMKEGQTFLRPLDQPVQDMTRRLVTEYYRVLLGHREALNQVGVKALATLLKRLTRLEEFLSRSEGHERRVVWRQAIWPVQTYNPKLGLHPIMLRPEYRMVPFSGRAHQKILDELRTWLQNLGREGMSPVGLRLYLGPGGAGKTRLLLEAGEHLRRQGWRTVFLANDAVNRDNACLFVDPPDPTLLIMDYMETREQEVTALLDALARILPYRSHALALVLLARGLPGWFRQLMQDNITDPNLSGRPQLLAQKSIDVIPHTLPLLHSEDRLKLFQTAVARFQQELELDGDASQPPPVRLPERPFFVLLLALLALAGETVTDPVDEKEILTKVWERERRKWHLYLKNKLEHQEWIVDAIFLLEGLLVATILGCRFHNQDEIIQFWNECFPSQSPDPSGTKLSPGWLAHHLDGLLLTLPSDSTQYWASIMPDPLSDWFLSKKIFDPNFPTDDILKKIEAKNRLLDAAIALHLCWGSPEVREIEDEVILEEICKRVDEKLDPKEREKVKSLLINKINDEISKGPGPEIVNRYVYRYTRSLNVLEGSVEKVSQDINTLLKASNTTSDFLPGRKNKGGGKQS